MAKLSIWQGSQHAKVTQRCEYTRICLDRFSEISWLLLIRILIIAVLNMQELHITVNMPQYG